MTPEVKTLSNLKILLLEDDQPAYAIAAKCGMHPSTLSKYAKGDVSIKMVHLRALSRYFKVPHSEIVGTTTFTPKEWDNDPF